MPETFAAEFKWPLDPFQQHAVAAISRDENVLVTAKTGSGKTLVGEAQIAHSLAKGRRVFYTTPIKSLSNQKFYDLKKMYPNRVGIMTGDIKFRPDAPIIIMTTEILRNLLFKRGSTTQSLGITADLSLDGLDAVVFDECHYINDRDRGAVWEETMILLDPKINLVLLSATIKSPEIFAAWLGELKQKPIHLISTQYRIIPLQHGAYRGEELLTFMDNKGTFDTGTYRAWTMQRSALLKSADDHKARVAERRQGAYEDAVVARGSTVKSFMHQMNELIGRLDAKGLLPALFFVFSRKECEKYAGKVEHTLIDSSDTASVKHIMDFHLHRYGDSLTRLPQYTILSGLLMRGIAFHHSGLLPVLKEIVEILFGRGFVKVLFATETFAVGINMPTKTVVFTGYRKYDDAKDGMRLLNTDEYIQMAGRAGRRGKDDKGLVLYLPDRDPENVEDIKRMMTGSQNTFTSRMTFHYDFLLKTMQAGNLQWLHIMQKSYWYRLHTVHIEAWRTELEILDKKIAATNVTEKEREALLEADMIRETVRMSVNAGRREAQKRWDAWDRSHIGPRWHALQKEIWPQLKQLHTAYRGLERDIDAAATPQDDVEPTLKALSRMGFLEEDLKTLTLLGTMATEVNEGHAIIMPKLYMSRALDAVPVDEIVAVLACFAGEGKAMKAPDELNVPSRIPVVLAQIDRIAKDCCALEMGAHNPNDRFWDVSTAWIEPIWRWLSGDEMAQICMEHEIYEGNFMRTLLKVANILEEWRTLATIAGQVDMLHKMRDIEKHLLRGVAVCDSLYLRI